MRIFCLPEVIKPPSHFFIDVAELGCAATFWSGSQTIPPAATVAPVHGWKEYFSCYRSFSAAMNTLRYFESNARLLRRLADETR
jgi:hypothetical protein